MITKKYRIIEKAKDLGFELAGFTKPEISSIDKKNYKLFLKKNYHGDMKWLERHYEKKVNPKVLWDKVKCILVLGINYSQKINSSSRSSSKGNISIYAKNKDYHYVIKKKLQILKVFLEKEFKIDSKIFVDSSPVFEKPLAQSAGIGWIGKHTNLVSKDIGSWFFLSEMYLAEEIANNKSEINHCGNCNDCINVCPTNAFEASYKLDARKCISYLTIEHKGPIPLSLRKKIGNKIYGCDDCLATCPWNKFAKMSKHKEFLGTKDLTNLRFEKLLLLTKKKFAEDFLESPIKRIGWYLFMRNIIIAAGNSKKKSLISLIKLHLKNEDPIVRGSAVWALGELMKKNEKLLFIKSFKKKEKNPYVLFEFKNL